MFGGDTDEGEVLDLCRVAGEDAPRWLAYSFAGSGLLMALAASYLAARGPSLESAPASRAPSAVTVHLEPSQPRAPSFSGEPKAQTPSATPSEEHKPDEARPHAPVECLEVISIGFPYKSSSPLTEGARERLAPVLDWLRKHPEGRLLVEGHTDSKGSEAFNVMLSYARAQAAIAWLVKYGVPQNQTTPLAAGPAQPDDRSLIIADNRMALLRVEGVAPCHNQDD